MAYSKSLDAAQLHIQELKQERDEFRHELGKLRVQYAALQAQFDDLQSEMADLKRGLKEHSSENAGREPAESPIPWETYESPTNHSFAQNSSINTQCVPPTPPLPPTSSLKRPRTPQIQSDLPNKSARIENNAVSTGASASAHATYPSAITLGDATVSRVLGGTQTFSINCDPLVVTRESLVSCFNISRDHAFSEVTPLKRRGIKKVRTFFLPPSATQNHLPTVPGAPGVIFYDTELSALKNVTLFVPRDDDKWVMMGEYRLEPGGNLAPGEFYRQSEETQRYWGRLIKSAPTFLLGKLREKVLNKCGISTPEQLEERDIVDVLQKNLLVLPIVRLRCVGYDTAIAEEIAQQQLFDLF